MAEISVGVIGTGYLGSLHAKIWKEVPTAKLSGVFDIDAARSAKVAGETGTTAFPDADALLAVVDAVSIATPTSTHAGIASRAIEMGKHVFIEKPVTKTEQEAKDLIALASRMGVKIQVGHIERFNPAILALEAYQLAPMFVESHRLAQFNPRASDVDVVTDLMIHDIDIIVGLVGSAVESVEANGVAVVSEKLDIANARLRFSNGCVANVTASRISQKKMRKMRLFQRDAYISVDFLDGVSEVFRIIDSGKAAGAPTMKLGEIETGSRKRTIVYEKPEIRDVNPLRYELEAFVDAVVRGRPPVVSAGDGLRALEVAHAILVKIEEQKISL
jgi:predicted dehydrogenase